QYTKTAPLERYRGAAECVEPILRYQDMDMYLRQDGEVYGLGSYWHEPRMLELSEVPTKAFSENGVSVLPFKEDDWAVPYAAAMELLPELKGVELPYRINGLLSWTPDGNPLIGESRELRGFWLAEAVWVTHGGGTGKMVAELMTSGETEWDTHEIDLYRFHDHVFAPDYIRQRGSQGYREAYDIIHPNYQAVHQRTLRRSPFYEAARSDRTTSTGSPPISRRTGRCTSPTRRPREPRSVCGGRARERCCRGSPRRTSPTRRSRT